MKNWIKILIIIIVIAIITLGVLSLTGFFSLYTTSENNLTPFVSLSNVYHVKPDVFYYIEYSDKSLEKLYITGTTAKLYYGTPKNPNNQIPCTYNSKTNIVTCIINSGLKKSIWSYNLPKRQLFGTTSFSVEKNSIKLGNKKSLELKPVSAVAGVFSQEYGRMYEMDFNLIIEYTNGLREYFVQSIFCNDYNRDYDANYFIGSDDYSANSKILSEVIQINPLTAECYPYIVSFNYEMIYPAGIKKSITGYLPMGEIFEPLYVDMNMNYMVDGRIIANHQFVSEVN